MRVHKYQTVYSKLGQCLVVNLKGQSYCVSEQREKGFDSQKNKTGNQKLSIIYYALFMDREGGGAVLLNKTLDL